MTEVISIYMYVTYRYIDYRPLRSHDCKRLSLFSTLNKTSLLKVVKFLLSVTTRENQCTYIYFEDVFSSTTDDSVIRT